LHVAFDMSRYGAGAVMVGAGEGNGAAALVGVALAAAPGAPRGRQVMLREGQ
jgi:hypothetical protein